MELPLELEDAIRAAPDDREAYLVAADWLQDRGQQQGELIVTDDRDRMIALLPAELRGESPFSIEWRWGFVRGVLLASMKDADEPRLLRELLASPIARFVQKLVVQNATSRLVDAIFETAEREPRALRCLRTLMLFVDDTTTPLDLARLPNTLRRLVLRVANTTGAFDLPDLLELSLDRMTAPLRVIHESALPALEMLQVAAGGDRPDRWLEPDRLPALRVLTLAVTAPYETDVWKTSAIGSQLDRLDLFDITPGLPTQRTLVIDRRGVPGRAALLVMVGPHRGELIELAPPSHALRRVSLRHAREQWRAVRDDARTHLFVNGHDITACPLRSLDEIAVGDEVFRFLEGDVDAAAARLRARYGLG